MLVVVTLEGGVLRVDQNATATEEARAAGVGGDKTRGFVSTQLGTKIF